MDCFRFITCKGTIDIYRFVCQYLSSNLYVILSGSEAVVFDPCEDEELIELLKINKVEKAHILLSHEHYDHISGVFWLKEQIEADIYCQQEAAKALAIGRTRTPALISTVLANEDRKDGGHRYSDFKAKFKPYTIQSDSAFDKEDSFQIGELDFQVTSTPGHSPGGACYILNEDIIFTGDTLLQYDKIILRFSNSKKNVYEEITLPYLRSLKKTMIVLPGHGGPFILSETNNI